MGLKSNAWPIVAIESDPNKNTTKCLIVIVVAAILPISKDAYDPTQTTDQNTTDLT